jgi:glycosyltransferase involved in cell wall biosynthesis
MPTDYEIFPSPQPQPRDAGSVDITIFIPCLNEEENVVDAMSMVFQAADRTGVICEIIVFDDDSKDRTADVVRQFQRDNPHRMVTLVKNRPGQGVAHNFVEGAFLGFGKYYRMVCGDNIEPLETHVTIFDMLGTTEIIIPSYTQILNRPLHRKIISKLYTFLVNRISGNRLSYYNGGAVFLRYDVMRYHVDTTGFGFQAEFLTRLMLLRRSYREIFLIAYDREGSTAINIKNVVSVLHSFMTIGLRRLRVRIFEP